MALSGGIREPAALATLQPHEGSLRRASGMTDPEPLVSVVIATNRGGPWLGEAVASVLAQTMDDLELIIVDDGEAGGLRELSRVDDRFRLVAGQQSEVAIARALVAGSTWAEIAQSLGVTTQAAHKRYRWIRYSEVTGEVWHERPLPL